MKRFAPYALAVILAAGGFARAEQKWTLSDWLKSLGDRVNQTEQKRKSQLTAAAAIRGAKKDGSSKKLYWKGKTDAQPTSIEEIGEFKTAVGLAQEGKTAEAEKSFTAFLEKYPKSAMAGDAKQTLTLLKEKVADDPAPATEQTPSAPEPMAPAAK